MAYLIGMDNHQIRQRNLQSLLAQYDSQTELAEKIGTLQGRVSDFLSGRRNIGAQMARRIEQAHQLPHGWMDMDHAGAGTADAADAVASLRADQIQLLQHYNQLSPKYQELLRETAAGFATLEQVQQQQQQQQQQQHR